MPWTPGNTSVAKLPCCHQVRCARNVKQQICSGHFKKTETTCVLTEFDAWPEACPTTGVADAETLRGSVNENVLNDEEPMEVDEAELQLSVAVAETANQDTEKTTGQTAKRKKQRKLKFTHKKRCTRPPATCEWK